MREFPRQRNSRVRGNLWKTKGLVPELTGRRASACGRRNIGRAETAPVAISRRFGDERVARGN
jgi:hypothetical protein